MVAIGQLSSSLPFSVICSAVSSETTVEFYLLLEDIEFRKVAMKADNIEELYDWVNENY